MRRRKFLRNSTMAGMALLAGPHSKVFSKTGGTRYMRLDSHIHLYDGGGNIDLIRRYFNWAGLTHGQVIVRSKDLHLMPKLKTIAPGFIPFEWPLNPLALKVDASIPVLGYKIHLRKPMHYNQQGEALNAASKELDPICSAAERLGRPFLFHSDADDPQICTMPQMAELAQRHPDTAFIAAHTAAYTQEFESGVSIPVKAWEAKLPNVLKQNFELLLDVKNLYADTVLLGRDYPERGSDPAYKLKLMIRKVGNMTPATKRALVNKFFIGTDFPWNYKKEDPDSGYMFQVKCMQEIFGSDFDETQTTKNFISLLPENVRGKYLKIYKYA